MTKLSLCINSCRVQPSRFLVFKIFCVSTWSQTLWSGMWVYTCKKPVICIGSRTATVLSNIFLSVLNSNIQQNLCGLANNIAWYADNCLIFVDNDNISRWLVDELKLFKEYGRTLSFTCESLKDGQLQLLDFQVGTSTYGPRSTGGRLKKIRMCPSLGTVRPTEITVMRAVVRSLLTCALCGGTNISWQERWRKRFT